MSEMMMRAARTLSVCLVALMAASCHGGGGSDLTSPSAPTNPQNTNLSGTWIGTMTRPAGLGSIAVRWVATQNNNANVQAGEGNVTGPFTMTNNGVSVEASVNGVFAGGTNNPGGINFRITLNAGSSSAFPACSVLSNATFTGFPPGATSLTSAPFDINYNSCQGFVAPTPPTNFTKESTVLSMTKQ